MKVYIETDRLKLRQWQESDRETFYEMNSDPIVMKYFPKDLTREQSSTLIDEYITFINKYGSQNTF